MNQIVWLASYPKSGNTWVRAFLANFQCDDEQPVAINALEVIPHAGRRDLFDQGTGIESSDLTPDEIDCYRPAAYRLAALEAPETLLLKIHDAYTLTPKGEPLAPTDVTRGAIYALRNPLDVAVSYSYHSGTPIDYTIRFMADDKAELAESIHHGQRQLRQKLLSWSEHVLSWTQQTELPVHLMRYEDMLSRPVPVFEAAVRLIGWQADPLRVARTVQRVAFENLQAQERAFGFEEKPLGMESFFRHGKAGGWRTELNHDQIAQIIQDHGEVMRRFGYLSETGEILC